MFEYAPPAARVSIAAAGLLLTLLGLGPAVASAQTTPLPPLPLPPQPEPSPLPPAEEDGDVRPVAAPVPTLVAPAPWDYELGTGGLWQRNVQFVPGGPTDWLIVPRARVSGLVWRPRGETRITAEATGFVYREQKSLNRADAGLALDGRYQLSRHLTWRIGASYSYGHADSSSILGEQGVLLPLTRADTLRASTGLAWQVAQRATFSAGARFYRVEFQDPAYVDSQSVRGTAELARRLGSRDTLGLVYSFERTYDRVERDTHYGSLRYTRLLGRASGLLLEGGLSYTADATRLELSDPWNYFGGVSLSRALGRSSLAAFYRYEVLPAFGLGGVRAGHRVGVDAAIPFGRAAELGLRASYFDEKSRGAVEPYRGTEAGASLGFRLASVLRLSFEADYRRRRTTLSRDDVDDLRAGAFLSIVPRTRGQEPRTLLPR